MFLRKDSSLFFLVVLFGFFISAPVIADNENSGAYSLEGGRIKGDIMGEIEGGKEVVEDLSKEEIQKMAMEFAKENLEKVSYMEPKIQNLSKLYWSLGMFNLEDPAAINNYLMINECQIYNDFYHNDFEWRKISEETRRYIKKNRPSFPRRFYFTRYIELGRYNFDTEAFFVVSDEVREGSRRYEMRYATTLHEVCGYSGAIPGYPKNMNITLSRPFRMKYVPVPKGRAQDYIIRTRYNYENKTQHVNDKISARRRDLYSRPAYIRFRLRVMKFLEYEHNALGRDVASVFAILEGYDVCEDTKCENILFTTGK
jgi:hypothetical protein